MQKARASGPSVCIDVARLEAGGYAAAIQAQFARQRKRDVFGLAVEFAHALSRPMTATRAITSRTSFSGAEAPAVRPMLPHALEPAALDVFGTIDQERARTPCFSASSRRRLELELLTEPTTSTRSTASASRRTASWRFCVA